LDATLLHRPIGPGRWAFALLALLLVPSWAAAQAPPPPPRPPAPAATQPSAPPGVPDYEIGPEDILKITVYGHEDLTQTVLVQADGTFTFPLIARVKADGMTPKQLEVKIALLLARGFIRNPQVTVVVQEFRSKTVFVVGEVARPGSYPLSGQRMTLVEILAKAGPVTVNAGAEVIIVRPAPDAAVSGPVLPTQVAEGAEAAPGLAKAEVFRINVRDIQAGDLQKNLELRPKDTVFVPQAPKVFVTGEVRNPGAYPWFPGMTARQLISMAGGLSPEGSDGRLKIVREQNGASHEYGIKLDELVKAGETLVVRRRLF
jgi:polysaccharide export outer membrane protein